MLKWCKSNNIQNNTFSVIIFSIFVFIVKAATEKNIKLCLIFPAADFGFLRSRLSLELNSFIKLWVLTGLMQAIKKPSAREGFYMAHSAGFELTTFWSVVRCSIQLSYECIVSLNRRLNNPIQKILQAKNSFNLKEF